VIKMEKGTIDAGDLERLLEYGGRIGEPIPVVVEHSGHSAIAPVPVRRADLRMANGKFQLILTVGND